MYVRKFDRVHLNKQNTYPTYDLVMVSEVGFAVLAAVDFLGIEVDVVGEAHSCRGWALGRLRR